MVDLCRPGEVLPYDCGPTEALGFPKRCADLCVEAVSPAGEAAQPSDSEGQTAAAAAADGGDPATKNVEAERPRLRALDVGCAVGGVTFELTRAFDEVRQGGGRLDSTVGVLEEMVDETAPKLARKLRKHGGQEIAERRGCTAFWGFVWGGMQLRDVQGWRKRGYPIRCCCCFSTKK